MKNKKSKIVIPTFTKEDGVKLQLRADFIYDLAISLERAKPSIRISDATLNNIIQVASRWDFKPIKVKG